MIDNENLNMSDVNDGNCLVIIKNLLKNGDINTIARIMTDYKTKVSSDKYKDIINLVDNSSYKEEVYSLIRGMLGIFG